MGHKQFRKVLGSFEKWTNALLVLVLSRDLLTKREIPNSSSLLKQAMTGDDSSAIRDSGFPSGQETALLRVMWKKEFIYIHERLPKDVLLSLFYFPSMLNPSLRQFEEALLEKLI